MMQQVHIPLSDFRKIVHTFDLHGLSFYPSAVLPIAALCSHLPDIDLRIKIRGKRIAVIACVGIENVQVMNFVKMMLLRIGGKHACYPRVKAAAQQRRNPGLFKALPVRPLPFIFKLCRIQGLIVGCIHIMRLCGKTRLHNR